MLFFHCSLHWLKVVGQICQHANFLNTTKQNLKEPSKVKTAVLILNIIKFSSFLSLSILAIKPIYGRINKKYIRIWQLIRIFVVLFYHFVLFLCFVLFLRKIHYQCISLHTRNLKSPPFSYSKLAVNSWTWAGSSEIEYWPHFVLIFLSTKVGYNLSLQ